MLEVVKSNDSSWDLMVTPGTSQHQDSIVKSSQPHLLDGFMTPIPEMKQLSIREVRWLGQWLRREKVRKWTQLLGDKFQAFKLQIKTVPVGAQEFRPRPRYFSCVMHIFSLSFLIWTMEIIIPLSVKHHKVFMRIKPKYIVYMIDF